MIRRTLLALALAASAWASPAAACTALETARLAERDGDIHAAHEGIAQISPADCDAVARVNVRRLAALALRRRAYADAGTLDEAEPLLREAAKMHPHWSVLAALGDLERGRGRHARAAEAYLGAVADLAAVMQPDSAFLDRPPSPEVQHRIRRRTEEARLASPVFVKPVGRPACRIAQGAGGWVESTVMPIRFLFDSDVFDEEGRLAARELAECLSTLDPGTTPHVTIIGHTDLRGDADYNRQLSLRRAEAVKRYLAGQGILLEMHVEGRGEDEPFVPDDGAHYTREERWRMDRRVEVDVPEN